MRRPVHATAGAFLQTALQCGVLVCFPTVSVAASTSQIQLGAGLSNTPAPDVIPNNQLER